MSGGGMGFLFSPARKSEAQARMQSIMSDTKRKLERSVPFAIEPVVYDFAINEVGTQATLLCGDDALMPANYYTLQVPGLVRTEVFRMSALRRGELERFTAACRTNPEYAGMTQSLFDHMLPSRQANGRAVKSPSLRTLLETVRI